jgi:hypothetical protein
VDGRVQRRCPTGKFFLKMPQHGQPHAVASLGGRNRNVLDPEKVRPAVHARQQVNQSEADDLLLFLGNPKTASADEELANAWFGQDAGIVWAGSAEPVEQTNCGQVCLARQATGDHPSAPPSAKDNVVAVERPAARPAREYIIL